MEDFDSGNNTAHIAVRNSLDMIRGSAPIFFLSKNTPDTVSRNPVPQARRWLHTPVHVRLLKYFRLLERSAVDICRPFLYAVLIVITFHNLEHNKKVG
ncbi:MAG: hypothetical protein ACLTVY_00005, partial [Faecalibacterium sp.]